MGIWWGTLAFKDPLIGQTINITENQTYLMIFTDPECEQCKLAQTKIEELTTQKDFKTLYYYPIQSGNLEGEKAVHSSICLDQSPCKEGYNTIEYGRNLAQSLHVKGLPHFIVVKNKTITDIIKGNQDLEKFRGVLE